MPRATHYPSPHTETMGSVGIFERPTRTKGLSEGTPPPGHSPPHLQRMRTRVTRKRGRRRGSSRYARSRTSRSSFSSRARTRYDLRSSSVIRWERGGGSDNENGVVLGGIVDILPIGIPDHVLTHPLSRIFILCFSVYLGSMMEGLPCFSFENSEGILKTVNHEMCMVSIIFFAL